MYSLKSSRQTSILTRKLEDLDYLNANCFIDGRINTSLNMKKVLSIGEILNEYLLHSNAPLAAAYRKHVQEMMASNESVDYIKKGERYD